MRRYRDLEIFPFRPLAKNHHALKHAYIERGKPHKAQDRYFTQKAQQRFEWDFLLQGLEQKSALREFWQAHQGRLKPFWLYSFTRDFELARSSAPRTQTLHLKSAKRLNGLLGRSRHLYIQEPSIHAKILTFENDEERGEEIILLDTTIENPLPPSTTIMSLFLVRLGSDELSFSYAGAGRYRTTLLFDELPKETP